MKPSHSRSARNNTTERIAKIRHLSRAEEKSEPERLCHLCPGEYHLGELLYESATSLIYRARRATDNQPVVLKMRKDADSGPEDLERLEREYEIIHSLQPLSGSEPGLEGVVGVYGLEIVQHHVTMVQEDFGGESLTRLQLAGRLGLAEFLRLAINITESLSCIHQRHLIHKNITPSNIVLNQATGLVKVIDFGISIAFSPEQPTLRQPTPLEGTLAYLAPEQTGRIHGEVDYRADLYSLGATLYELLTGHPPFEEQDALEVVFSHLARQPVSPQELNPSIPKPLADLVLKLLEKNPDHRYQTASGLKADLEICLQQWNTRGTILPFLLAARDVPDHFTIPQQLYGREHETVTLSEVFERVAAGQTAVVLVAGAPGIGKTALVQQVYQPLTWRRGYFTFAKFEQRERDIPYSAVMQAFSDLLRQVLAEGEEQMAQWRKLLLAALGPNGRVIADLIPELTYLLGPQPDIPDLGPAERLNRFYFVFQQFLHLFTRPEHPLVIFLDDVQWADEASLRLLEQMSAGAKGYLLLVGAYRDTEVHAAHPLLGTVARLKQSGISVHHFTLAPLEENTINHLVADTLHSLPEMVKPLAAMLARKTGGNPFFLREFFEALHTDGFITFDYEQHQWRWDFTQIEEQGFAENVTDFLNDQIRKLPAQSLESLKIAACVGYQFNLQTIARVSAKAAQEAATSLVPAVAGRLIAPLAAPSHRLGSGSGLAATEACQFAHDAVQHAVYALIPDTDRPRIHYAIGQALLAEGQDETRLERFFELVDHLNLGRSAISDPAAWEALAQLNLMAGKRARTANAYKAAAVYLTAGQECLAANSWQTQYELTLDLSTEAIEAAYLNGDLVQAWQMFDVVIQKAKTVLDTIRAYEIRMQWHMAQNQMPAAINIGLHVLKLLDVPLETEPPEYRAIGDFYTLPSMTDPQKLAAMRVLGTFLPAAIFVQPALVSSLTFTMMRLCIGSGNAPEAALAYALYGANLCSKRKQIEEGYQFGALAMQLAGQFNVPTVSYKVALGFMTLIQPFGEKAGNTLEALRLLSKNALEVGDTFYASHAAFRYSFGSFLVGLPLETVQQRVESSLAFIQAQKQRYPLTLLRIWGQVVENLHGKAADAQQLVGECFDESSMLPRLQAEGMRRGLFFLYAAKTCLSYLFRDSDTALQATTLADQYQFAEAGRGLEDIYQVFYTSLVFLDRWSKGDHQPRYLEQVAANQQLMQIWAQHAPMNFQHKYALVEAERARVLGRYTEASEQYHLAIQGAWEHGYLQDEALAYELAAEFYLSRGMERMVQTHLRFAYSAYQRWGAEAKLEDLAARYPHYIARQADEPLSAATGLIRPPRFAGNTEVHLKAGELDLPTLLKTAQAISAEVHLEDLLKQLLHFALENAGAEKGVLLLEEQGRWTIGAIGRPDHVAACLGQPQQLEDTEEVPAEVIHYVARTHEAVVISDATSLGYFTKAPYIIRHQCKSILCFPLLNQGRLNSMLYLENNLTTGAFTEDRLDLLRWLSAQIAISIDNARIYQQLEQKVQERTQALKEEIAERERAEQALRRQENLFRTLVENAPDIIARFDRNLRHLYMSPAIEAATGIPAQEFIGHTYAELGIPEQRYAPWNQAIRKAFETGQGDRLFEFESRAPDRTQYYESRLIPEFADDGSVASVLSITTDITELKQTEEAVRESERFVRSIVDALSEQICVLDETGTIVAVNKSWRDFGETNLPVFLNAGEGANYLAVCDAITGPDAQDAQTFAAGIRTVISGERSEFSMEYPYNTPTEQRWFVGRVTRIPGESPVRLVVAHEDISERKWVEQALREAINLAEAAQLEAEVAEQEEEKRRQEAERRRQIAESLREVVSILNSSYSLDDVLHYIVAQVVLLLGCRAAAIYRFDPESGAVEVQAAIGFSDHYLSSARLSTKKPASRQNLLTPWPVTIPDIAAVVPSQDDPGQEIQDLVLLAPPTGEYRALLAVPILIKDEIYGRLRLYYRAPRHFSEEEADLAILFSDQAALAIETARLREQVKQAAVIDERNRLARDLHDSVTQTIFSAHLIAEALPRIWESHPKEGRHGLEELHRLIQGALAEMRTLLLELRPAAIIEKELGGLLKQLAQTAASQTQAAITCTVEGDRVFPAEVQIALYRIVQEALNNIIKHAKPSQIVMNLHCQPDIVVVRIRDNGCGFDLSAIPPDHLGINIMRERAHSIGAIFELTSQPGQGTEVLVIWPESTGGESHD
jgi:PAS domain S-box-containing protein